MAADTDGPAVEVYWRPGCRFCSSMRTALAGAGVDATWRNIWKDADAAEFVRSVAAGNETVPTVRIDDEALVAPRPRLVIDRLVQIDPALVGDPRRWPPVRIAQWVIVAVLLIAANSVAAAGRDTLSLVIDGAAVAAYVAFRHLRSRPRRGSRRSRLPGEEVGR
jgi:mycoredoxin